MPEGDLPAGAALPPLQPVPVLAPGMIADPRLVVAIGVAGSIAAEEVHRLPFPLFPLDALPFCGWHDLCILVLGVACWPYGSSSVKSRAEEHVAAGTCAPL